MSDIQEGIQSASLTNPQFSPDVIKAAQDILAASGVVQTVSTTGAVIPPKSAEEHLHEVSQAVVSAGVPDTTAIGGEPTLQDVHSRLMALEIKVGQILRRYFRTEDFAEPTTP